MRLIKSRGTAEFDELDVRMTVAQLQSIERAMRQYEQAVLKAGRETFHVDQDVLAGLWEIVNELELPSLPRWP